ncbi:MAG: 1-deoxy-D-xylulose-5-phosphate reductoisomerase [Bacilli bacterium]|nr:1-deoxy-D-xylulose-5-phosphate reductoisomerase [Bacilli bacterium]
MKIILLGASGSIGSQTLELLEKYKNKWDLHGFSVGNRVEKIHEILSKFDKVKYICVKNKGDYLKLKKQFPNIKFYYGDEGLIKLINSNKNAYVLNALVGFVGLKPTLKALNNNQTVLLANKESIVCGGDLIKDLLKKGKGKIIPIDSEHVAIAKCLYGHDINEVESITITASGGPFYFLGKDEFKNIKLEDALNHPTWKMGNKITIDSATLVNKTFEIIEAFYLFDMPLEKINVVVDRKSYVHGFVKFKDGSVTLNVSKPSMLGPIDYALNLGIPSNGQFEDLEQNTLDKYELLPLDKEKFSVINNANTVILNKGTSGTILNAANEKLVNLFLNKRINFLLIYEFIDKIMNTTRFEKSRNYSQLKKIDSQIKERIEEELKNGSFINK